MQIVEFADNGKEIFFFSCSAVQTKGLKLLICKLQEITELLSIWFVIAKKGCISLGSCTIYSTLKKYKNQLHIYFDINQDKLPEISCDYIFTASLHNLYWIQNINRTKKSLKNRCDVYAKVNPLHLKVLWH